MTSYIRSLNKNIFPFVNSEIKQIFSNWWSILIINGKNQSINKNQFVRIHIPIYNWSLQSHIYNWLLTNETKHLDFYTNTF